MEREGREAVDRVRREGKDVIERIPDQAAKALDEAIRGIQSEAFRTILNQIIDLAENAVAKRLTG